MNPWLDLLELLGPDYLFTTIAILLAFDVLFPVNEERSNTMNEKIRQQLLRLDVNGNGKVDIADAQALMEEQLAKRTPKAIAAASFIGGLVVGFVAGRASK